jgi:hypothetical protein
MNLKIISSIALLLLGATVATSAVPDKKGMTLKGNVSAKGKPVKDVVVSDGVEITTTDSKGNYWLPSKKSNGWVYVSIPSGYEVPTDRSIPEFYALTTDSANIVEEHNFTLTPVKQDKFKLLVVSDMHLANRRNDREQFSSTFIPVIQKEVEEAGKTPVYTLNLGDMSFDMYWYSNKYAIEQYKKSIQVLNYPTPMFHVPGNHDNDGAVTAPTAAETDFKSVQRYVKALGPNYYSFNIGKAHIVMLDNIIYKNEPGGTAYEGINGSRNYKCRVTAQQLEWLKKDLANVKDKTAPVFVGMHAAIYHYKGATDSVISWLSKPEYSEELSECFKDFTNVHYLSGHHHYNNTTYAKPNIIEHNIGAVCGVWWYPGTRYNENICMNGAPAGYKVFNVDGTKMDWTYLGTISGNKQFRVYDMNTVREFYRTNPDIQTFISHHPTCDLSNIPDNQIYINVFDWSPDWKVTVKEGGEERTVTHEMLIDPYFALIYQMPYSLESNYYSKSYNRSGGKMNHMFKVQATTDNQPIVVTVTDHFGRTYTETVERPKAFIESMK